MARLSKYQMQQERSRLRREAEIEKDTVYEPTFVRKSTKSDSENAYFKPVKLFGNPKGRDDLVDMAIDQFQRREGVKDWREIAESHHVSSYWYP